MFEGFRKYTISRDKQHYKAFPDLLLIDDDLILIYADFDTISVDAND